MRLLSILTATAATGLYTRPYPQGSGRAISVGHVHNNKKNISKLIIIITVTITKTLSMSKVIGIYRKKKLGAMRDEQLSRKLFQKKRSSLA